MRDLVIASKNEKKLKELKKYLKGLGVRIHLLTELGKTPRVIENGDTFKKNAIKKALTISKVTKGLVLADDSGLAVDALGGLPGVHSSRFSGPGKKDHQNNMKLLHLLKGVPLGKRRAHFICAVAIADKGKIVKVIEEDCRGLIAHELKGRHGFGYDPLFLIPKYKKTFGQLGPRIKDRMSHRAKALKKARNFLRKYI